MSEDILEEKAPGSNIQIDENEVAQISESIHEAQYFDASSMAPLTPASLVSITVSKSRYLL